MKIEYLIAQYDKSRVYFKDKVRQRIIVSSYITILTYFNLKGNTFATFSFSFGILRKSSCHI